MSLISFKNIVLRLGGTALFDGIDLRLEKGERVCLLGRNGEGKSTLLEVLAGNRSPDSGDVVPSKGLRIGYLPQRVPSNLSGSVRSIVADGVDHDQNRIHLVEQAATQVGIDPDAEFSTMSIGGKRRTLLARALVDDPGLLILDEPTNHLDIDAIDTVESLLGRFRGTIVFVTHDRAFLRRMSQRIIELDRGQLRDWSCDYDTFLRRREESLRDEVSQRAEFDKKLAQEEVWVRQGVRERRTRNEGRVRSLLKMREEHRARREQVGKATFSIQEGERGGKLVFNSQDLEFGYDSTPIIKDLSTMVIRGDKLGIVGPNGCGKTTLLRLLLGELSPTGGEVRQGINLQVAYFDQNRDQLDETLSIIENVTGGNEVVEFQGRTIHAVTYLKHFLFTAERIRIPITHLSGGERNRLLLAKLFTQPANLLVMDEPTNDLDLETLELLEELLLEYEGTVLLVSHDREFLDRVATSTLVFTPTGIVETVGGWSDWRQSRDTEPAKAALPKAEKKIKSRSSQSGPKKLTWKEQRELEALPAQIETAETSQQEFHDRLADPALYQSGGDEVVQLKAQLETIEAELADLYERWEKLESIREATE
jgi:ABC transport system ATP-binding/permease protein